MAGSFCPLLRRLKWANLPNYEIHHLIEGPLTDWRRPRAINISAGSIGIQFLTKAKLVRVDNAGSRDLFPGGFSPGGYGGFVKLPTWISR